MGSDLCWFLGSHCFWLRYEGGCRGHCTSTYRPSVAPCLAPALQPGQGEHSRNSPVSCRAGFLHSGIFIPRLLQSWWEHRLMCGGPSAMPGASPAPQVGAYPSLIQCRGFSDSRIPSSQRLLTSFPSCFPDRGHCSQRCLLGAAHPPALPRRALRSLLPSKLAAGLAPSLAPWLLLLCYDPRVTTVVPWKVKHPL